MREVKFRVPCVCQNGCRSYWFYELNGIDEPETIVSASDYNIDCRCKKINFGEGWMADGQEEMFTGLKDKNGVEIYEGDLLSYFEDVAPCCVVIFEEGRFLAHDFRRDEKQSLYMLVKRSDLDYVVGTRHENPGLLTKKR